MFLTYINYSYYFYEHFKYSTVKRGIVDYYGSDRHSKRNESHE